MCKKLLNPSRFFVVVLLISLFLLTSACIVIVPPSTTPTTTTQLNRTTIAATTTLPPVKFQSVTIPNNVPQYFTWGILADYTSTFTVRNYGSFDVAINWDGNSSAVGHFDGGTIIVPANSFQTVTRTYYYTVSGNIRITYTLSHNSTVLDTWTGTSYMIPQS